MIIKEKLLDKKDSRQLSNVQTNKVSPWEITMDRMEKNIIERMDELIVKMEIFLKRPPVKYRD